MIRTGTKRGTQPLLVSLKQWAFLLRIIETSLFMFHSNCPTLLHFIPPSWTLVVRHTKIYSCQCIMIYTGDTCSSSFISRLLFFPYSPHLFSSSLCPPPSHLITLCRIETRMPSWPWKLPKLCESPGVFFSCVPGCDYSGLHPYDSLLRNSGWNGIKGVTACCVPSSATSFVGWRTGTRFNEAPEVHL